MHTSRPISVLSFVAIAMLAGCTTSAGMTSDIPLPNAGNRATPLSFGMHVTPDPEQNPIDPPERFAGYHAAVDFEVSAGEVEGDVPVSAICRGRVVYSGFAEGYGGLLIHRCRLNGEDVTVLYGHLSLEGLPAEGSTVKTGQIIGLLAPAQSHDSGGTRKHLHLGIRRGKHLDVRGYVQTEEELKQYIDPMTILPEATIDLPGDGPGERPYWESSSDS